MSKVAFIFPGQGSQYVGMGEELAQSWEPAQQVYRRANEALGFDIATLCWNGPEEKLGLTEYTQPAILATSFAIHEVLIGHGVTPQVAAGHSLGEYTALVSAGGLDFEEALNLVRKRGRYMQEAVQPGFGAMAAILGLSRIQVEEICRKAQKSGIVSPANFNAPTQVVIAGEKKAVHLASKLARETGAKRVIPLAVSVPSHCRLMRTAAKRLADDLQAISLHELKMPLVANIHAKAITKPDDMREALIKQLELPVLWVETVIQMKEQGVNTFIEVGPGKVLAGLVRRIIQDVHILHIEDTESLEKTLEELKVHH
jgi:[acyl-carrier-protein] S-malonyltransferase